jgi:Secretion system C-terminal sorting domain
LVDVANASSENQSFTSMRVKDDMIVMTSYAGNGATLSAVAFDTSGNFLWSKMITSRGGMDVEIDDNHNVYLLSQKDNQVSAQSNRDIVIFKLNQQGDLIDTFGYDFGNSTEFASRMTLVNNKITIIGQTIELNGGYMNWITLQIDLDGNNIWSATYDYFESNDEAPLWLTALENGEVYVSGKGGPAYTDFNGSQYLQYVTLRYNNGNIVWRDTDIYQGYTGIVNTPDNDCGIYVLGETSMTLNHYTDECITLSSREDDTKQLSELSVYPNPAQDNITISLNQSSVSGFSISIFDATGNLIHVLHPTQFKAKSDSITFDFSNYATGVYNIVIQDGINKHSEKVIKF